jgi:AAA+ ATPase superfamily predicted ATPase
MMTKFIGRVKEIQVMEGLKNSDKSEFLAVYGRRRVGKTYLIRHVFESDFVFQLTGQPNTKLQWQLANFHRTLVRIRGEKIVLKPAKNWFEAFQQLMDLVEAAYQPKKVIFLDELPWFDTPQSGFLSALEHFWNSWATTRQDVILAVCGSSASWIINKVINNKGGLHNRITKRIKLEPFTLAETEAFFKSKNSAFERYQIAQLYMVLGGIPFYLEMVDMGQSAVQNINRLCFESTGELRTEFGNLYSSLFKKAQNHVAVIEALATKSIGLNRDELIKLAKINNGGGATTLLQELEECGFIRKYPAFGKKEKYHIYQLIDFYSLFYLTFIKDTSLLDDNLWINGIDNPAYRAWSGYAFEMVCLHHLKEIKHTLGISGVFTTTSSWYAPDKKQKAQIDLVIDRRDGIINLCEMKFSIKPFTIEKRYADELKNKIELFREQTSTQKSTFLTMITAFGLQRNEHSNAWVQNSITLNELFIAIR